ncbi:MAG: FHA domain-containing protein [Deltaproteobacteria bacterium]|nr:FHA domain-containing protein [Deltaproteobacteria bacterium]
MIPGIGKPQLTVGSSPTADIVVQGPGVGPNHLSITMQNGTLVATDLGTGGGSSHAGMHMQAGVPMPLQQQQPLYAGQVQVPLNHPSIGLLLLTQGAAPPQPGRVSIGREATRVNVAVAHPAVSGLHATVDFGQRTITDHDSKSGTYINGQRIPANTPTPLGPDGIVQLGPVTLPLFQLSSLAQPAPQFGTAYAPPQPVPQQAPQYGQPQYGQPAPGGYAPPVLSPAQGVAMPPAQAPLGSPAQGVPMPPQQAPGAQAAPRGGKARTMIGEAVFGAGSSAISIGRTPDNQIAVSHPQVSSKHATLFKEPDGRMFLMDRGSANGTYVRGQRIAPNQRVEVQNGEKVYIGPMPLVIQMSGQQVQAVVEVDSNAWAGKPTCSIEAWSLYLEVPDRDNPSTMKVLLDNVSFKALPGDLIALMGPSGAGKTTLLMTLNGYQAPTSGQVRINGEDLYEIYDMLRGSIGYVPQDDIVHPELTVYEAVKYSAKFRLPPDMSEDEIDQRVMQTLRDLGLEQVMNLQIGKPEKKILSGGQRKRVNIALELVTDPVIMFLDEPTSGLAADDTTALIALLSDLAKKTGKTIIVTIHQPAKDEYEKFNIALIMGYGGVPIYYGPTAVDSYRFFGRWLEMAGKPNDIDNPRDMFDMLKQREAKVGDELKARDPNTNRGTVRLTAAKQWRQEFYADSNPTYQKMYSGNRAIGQAEGQKSGGSFHRGLPPYFRQLGLLISRYYKVKVRDRAGTAIMLLQAPIIGALLILVFGPQRPQAPPWCLAALQGLKTLAGGEGVDPKVAAEMAADITKGHDVKDISGSLFFMVVSAIWFGTSNAAREIVSERAIYLRERMVNLRLTNYVLSKYILLSFVCVLQCLMLLGIVAPALGYNGLTNGHPEIFLQQLGMLVVTAMDAVAIGLLLSTVVASSEAAMALTPIALIPQVVLGGTLVPVTTNALLEYPMMAIPARWGFEGAIAPERVINATEKGWLFNLPKGKEALPPDIMDRLFLKDVGDHLQFACPKAYMGATQGPNSVGGQFPFEGAWGFVEWQQQWMPYAVLGGMTLITLVIMMMILRKKDPV